MRPEQQTKEEIGETVILEQLLRVLPVDTWTWVREHEPEAGLIAAKLALQYLNAQKGAPQHRPAIPSMVPRSRNNNNTEAETTLHKLDVVQAKALRVCSGAFRTTPVPAMQVDVGESPLRLRRAKLGLNY
ncbi:hypothetical protein SKAU_G00413180 [Synaphobranchus kaupii]|uniref:SCAN box domain-containing protein n=1 Tax=Synaphobranchus kaupii TaxID=118154 RepID=A0A9Q1E879_SYNKA|nr:hypothetical protein SKAU_G00413180 [Synaphobranchus kaupii]